MVKAWLQKNLKGDPVIWGIILCFSLISILVVYSAIGSLAYKMMKGDTEHYLFKHSFLVFLSLACMWIAHKIDYKYYSKLSKLGLWLSIPLLVFAYFKGGDINGASRWFIIPVINQSFQPSDFAKLALIANLASMLAKRQANIEDFKESFIPIVLWSGLICGLIALSNLSTAVLLFSTCLLLMFIGRVPFKFLAMLVLVGGVCGTIALKLGQRLETAISRLEYFFVSKEIPFQAEQSYKAIATGMIFGKGPGQSVQGEFLPHSYSDFIYSIIIEEYGFIGAFVVLFLYLALLYRAMLTVSNSERAYGGLLSAGLAFSLVIQAMINMGVAVGLGPITGQPLPLLSMGGTSLLFTGISLGIILSVSRGDISETNFESKNGLKKQTV
ncbi:cell division protein [Sporocytophaga myxococcoides]|uniref:Probable peptidoglycan glycosyltransferase FtsW n=1 Tax=Sporocytophaga myxococcoides TaxID=153721 RepID=A0A098LJ69_9BACT|nr:FtsW/RodA/SpoVE family cell cycle protein [Sporocytophaga myxococcoides]GAL86990.1 cell division protein [Sporocytophaga myxococcoides]